MIHVRSRFPTVLSCVLLAASVAARAEEAAKPLLKKGARVAVVGDSITEQRLYSKYIELYLTCCTPQYDVRTMQFGWGGETAGGFLRRMENDLLPFKPDLVTTCYGMNDGGYGAFNDGIGKRYADPTAAIVKRLKEAGATVVVGSPGVVDSKYFQKGGDGQRIYNATLGRLRDIARRVAEENGMPFANVYDAMLVAMEKSKESLGADYPVGGRDGVHPSANGHLVMAYAFLKAMGLNGQIATITVDLAGATTASEGHTVASSEKGKVTLESQRYPFCFSSSDPKSQENATRSILPFVPFNKDLNRFTLIVKNLDSARAKVTWGTVSRDFSKAELEEGVNLADAFLDTPFADAFKKVEAAVGNKQGYETSMIKEGITKFPGTLNALEKDKEVEAALELMRQKYFAKHDKMHAAVRAAFAPVKHTLTIEALK